MIEQACGICPNDKITIEEKIEEISNYINSEHKRIAYFANAQESSAFTAPEFEVFCTPNELTKLGMLTRIAQCCTSIMNQVSLHL